jgi:hypothetical protein
MGIKRLTQKSSTAALAGAGIVTTIAGLTTLAMVLIGLPPAASPAPQAAADPTIVTADWKQSPATGVLTDALNNPPAGWSKQGDLQKLVTAPLPYSCPQPGLAPSVSLARTYTTGNSRFQVITLAYTAGIGAEAMQKQAINAYVCAGPETGLSLWGVNGPGSDTKQATTARGGVLASVLSFRRGDVITYVTGSPADPLQNLAAAFDEGLTRRLSAVCVNQDSTAAGATRSPWSGAGYKPYTEEAKVAIADVPLPATEPTATPTPEPTGPAPSPAPVPSPTATLERVSLPAPGLIDRTADPMARPAYPVAPAMPAPVAEPTAPTAPAAKATLEKSVQVPANDARGPGCGWAFTGMKPLAFDDAAATKTRTALLAETKAKLEADAKTWQASVLTYWTDYATYKKAATDYNAYAAKVDEVNKAWAVIGNSWDTYNRAVQDRDRKVTQRADFIARQDAARKDYDTKTAQCAAVPVPSPSASPTPSPSPSPTVSASPSPSPSPSATAQPGCPVDRPAILDQAAPEVPSEPVRPADPAKG